jgi:F-type H+-transporting ATPase subunit b
MSMKIEKTLIVALTTFALTAPAWAAEAGEAHAESASNPFAGDIGNALWTLVVFVAVLVVLGKFAWGPILSNLQAREDFIRNSLNDAKRDREAAEARLKEYADKLAAARGEASAIVDEGRRDAEAVKRRIEEDARAEAAQIVARGKREIEIATETAVKEIYTLSAKLSTEIAGRIIGRELKVEDHERLIAQSIEELGRTAPAPERAH